jgi:DNA-binding NarL/FixJ family response regulator
MKVLIIEDDDFKLKELAKFVEEHITGVHIELRRSYQSGLKAAVEISPELILLDMSLPNFDISRTEAGYGLLFFAGRDILLEIRRFKLSPEVIVVTQFEQFGEGDQLTTLEELRQQLASQFPKNYLATVYYHPAQDDWKNKLRELIQTYLNSRPK